jgi:hypothetical protein
MHVLIDRPEQISGAILVRPLPVKRLSSRVSRAAGRYPERGADAHPDVADGDRGSGFAGSARSGPDLRPGLSGLPADLSGLERLLLRMRLDLTATMQCLGIRPRRAMRRQPVLHRAQSSAPERPAAPPRLLRRDPARGRGRRSCEEAATSGCLPFPAELGHYAASPVCVCVLRELWTSA